jgi:Ni/Fe-hydrogenase subunit HybB-like protein
VKKVYPFMVAGAYVLPLMHQSSLGGLMLLAGPKVHPLWQSQMLPLLYVGAACICGFAFVTGVLLVTCYRFDRPVSIEVMEELGNLLSWVTLAWLALRLGDIVLRGMAGEALSLGRYALLFHAENLLLLVPALVLRGRRHRETPHTLFLCAVSAGAGGLLYRFVPTTIAFDPGGNYGYFPALPEVLMTAGFVSAGIVGFMVAVRWFAILPGRLSQWPRAFLKSGPHNLT